MNWLPTVVIAMSVWIVGWGSWVTLQIMAVKNISLSREEHAKICESQNKDLDRRLDKIETAFGNRLDVIQKSMERKDQVDMEFRHGQNNAMMEVKTSLALLSRDYPSGPGSGMRRK